MWASWMKLFFFICIRMVGLHQKLLQQPVEKLWSLDLHLSAGSTKAHALYITRLRYLILKHTLSAHCKPLLSGERKKNWDISANKNGNANSVGRPSKQSQFHHIFRVFFPIPDFPMNMVYGAKQYMIFPLVLYSYSHNYNLLNLPLWSI